ncbi:MAG: hypothetical protein ACREM3_28290 [Candidatus Rokuibacteriota bacterium]
MDLLVPSPHETLDVAMGDGAVVRVRRHGRMEGVWPPPEAYRGPVKLIAADPHAKGAPGPAFANRALAEDFGYVYEAIPGTGHLQQIQRPEACRRAMLEFLEERGIV